MATWVLFKNTFKSGVTAARGNKHSWEQRVSHVQLSKCEAVLFTLNCQSRWDLTRSMYVQMWHMPVSGDKVFLFMSQSSHISGKLHGGKTSVFCYHVSETHNSGLFDLLFCFCFLMLVPVLTFLHELWLYSLLLMFFSSVLVRSTLIAQLYLSTIVNHGAQTFPQGVFLGLDAIPREEAR